MLKIAGNHSLFVVVVKQFFHNGRILFLLEFLFKYSRVLYIQQSKQNSIEMQSTLFTALSCLLFFYSCKNNQQTKPIKDSYPVIGTIEKYDDALSQIINDSAKAEIIAHSEAYQWTEGPLMIDDTTLIFSDVPNNIIHRWTENSGTAIFLKPSGYTDTIVRGGEMGSNGLTLNRDGKLVLCQHGDRRIALMNAEFSNPKPDFTSLADNYNGKKFNSPNDAICNKDGDIFFTDPPYGLPKQMEDPTKEISFQGVYKVSREGKVTILVDSLTRPNGIALLPGEKSIIIANSDHDKPIWYQYDYDGNKFVNGKIFYSLQGYDREKLPGLPDGLKIDSNGNVFATGPGGVYIFNKDGKKLGLISLQEPSSNCTLSKDEKTLYVTNNKNILRIKLR